MRSEEREREREFFSIFVLSTIREKREEKFECCVKQAVRKFFFVFFLKGDGGREHPFGLSLSLSVLLLVQVHPECVARAVVLIYFSFFVCFALC